MKRKHFPFLLLIALTTTAVGQTPPPPVPTAPTPLPQSSQPQAKIQDVGSMEAIIHSLYDVLSGPPGQARDWDRFRSLFVPSARLGAAVKIGDGTVHYFGLDVPRYIAMNAATMGSKGFFESEIHRHVDSFGNMCQVFSTYELRAKADDPKPFERGINSIQLIDDGKRWWIISVFWQAEDDKNPLPRQWVRG